ncbi:MAG: hypothetical protein HQL96_14685 [Magnetococcales bacterium]|nr:hypothetical protein [Magnetococcales bacterium]
MVSPEFQKRSNVQTRVMSVMWRNDFAGKIYDIFCRGLFQCDEMRRFVRDLVKNIFEDRICTIFVLVAVLSISESARADNLLTCLTGRYPSLCRHEDLTNEEANKVKKAEHAANLKTCLTGRYPSLCRHEDLTNEEANKVKKAEHAANLKTCLTGRYPSLCRHEDLTNEEANKVKKAEHAANLKTCLTGRYQSLCRHEDLNSEEYKRVESAEVQRPYVPSPLVGSRVARSLHGGSGCESGHWIQEVMSDGRIIALEDGTMWQVDEVDLVHSTIWLPVSNVVVCDGMIINTDDNETVHAIQIK